MEKHTLKLEVRKCTEMQDFKKQNGQRKLGMIYYQYIDGGFIFRTVTDSTSPEWLLKKIEMGVIFVDDGENIVSELS
jgi:hypothetical protein